MKKIIILLMSIFILSCETLQNSARELSRSFIEENKPDITVKSAKLKSITLNDITLECVLELINTSGKVFSKAYSVESLKIPANETRAKTIIFNAKYFEVYSTALTSLKNRNLKCVAKTYITFTMARMKFRFLYTKEIVFIE